MSNSTYLIRPLQLGRYMARSAQSQGDKNRAMRLRQQVFRSGSYINDWDRFDEFYETIIIEDIDNSQIVCTFRIFCAYNKKDILRSYCASFYDLSLLSCYSNCAMDIGRFCIAPGVTDHDVIRMAWAVIAFVVKEKNVDMLLGCPSFSGTDANTYANTLALLGQKHIAPSSWRPQAKVENVVQYDKWSCDDIDHARALREMPSILRTYLHMGGLTSDHGVIDNDLNTIHIFIGVEIKNVTPARARSLNAAVAQFDEVEKGNKDMDNMADAIYVHDVKI